MEELPESNSQLKYRLTMGELNLLGYMPKLECDFDSKMLNRKRGSPNRRNVFIMVKKIRIVK